MKELVNHIVAGAFILIAVIGPVSTGAQESPSSTPASGESVYTEEQLDQLLAPIALYPDALLGQVLMAATYPLEVVEAARWVSDSNNASLKGDALSAALSNEDWAPSVKSLVPFPQVLQMMDTHLDWMEKLGDAFLAQQGDVMSSVQRLRDRAQAAGTLRSTPQQTVAHQGQTIVIEPAEPEVIYVPVYNPAVVYGVWPYLTYPPYYFPPPPGYIVEPSLVTGFYFAAGIITVSWLWDWYHIDWHRHRVDIDAHRFNVINVHRPPITHDVWVHDRYHRRGVPYPSPAVRSRFEPVRPGAPVTHREFRGFDQGTRIIRPATPPRNITRPPTRIPRETPPRTSAPRVAPRSHAPRTPSPREAGPRTPPPAFQDYTNGAGARRDAERGQTSRRSMSSGKFAPSRDGQAPRSGGETRGRPGGRRDGGERRH